MTNQQVHNESDEQTARVRRKAMFDRIDMALGDKPILEVDAADAVRADRDEHNDRSAP